MNTHSDTLCIYTSKNSQINRYIQGASRKITTITTPKKNSPPSTKLLDNSRAARVVRGNPSVIVGQWTGRIALCTRCYRDHVSLCLPHVLCVCRNADAVCTASRGKRAQLFKLRRLITNETVCNQLNLDQSAV